MKKKIGMTIGAVATAGILGLGVFHSSATQAEPAMTTGEIKEIVGKQYPGEVTDVKQKTEFKQAVYQVQVSGDKQEYSLKLDGDNGDVLDIKEKPVEKEPVKKQADKPDKLAKKEKQEDKNNKKQGSPDQKNTGLKKAVITEQRAAEIALNEFSGEIEDIDFDEEDGRLIYEVEIERGEQEAEIEIDAYTGEVIVIEIEED